MQEHYVPTDDAISSYAITQRDIYEYDYLNRIKQVTGVQRTTAGAWPTIYGQGFIYDRWGNRRIDPATGVTWGNAINNAFFTIDPANNNRLVGLGYDAAGNVTNDTITGSGARAYDAENRMTSAQGSGGTSYYVYDADGKRVRRITGGVETWHIYGFGGELIAEYPANGATGSPSKEYGYRGGQMLIVGDSTNVRWTMTDALGTPRIVAGKTGALTDVTRHDYLPFGEELFVNMGTNSIRTTGMGYGTGGTNDGIRKKFTGYERDDETGLDFAQARYFSSRQGRFTSPDEFTGGPDELFDFADVASDNPTFYADLTDPQSLNKYQYCYNNPLSNVDPDGHSVWSKAIKFAIKVYKKGDAAAAAVETAEDALTVVDSSKSKGERVFAAVSLISEISPVSISDVRDVYRWLKPAAKKIDAAADATKAGDKTLVVGKLDDLKKPGAVGPNEKTLNWEKKPTPKENWKVNDGLLRAEMKKDKPIRDTTVNRKGEQRNNTGFLRAERNRLKDRGWNYDKKTRTHHTSHPPEDN